MSTCTMRDLLELAKFRQTLFLTLAMLLGVFAAGIPPLHELITMIVIAVVSISATTALNMVYDADIDAVMSRTRNRPIPAGRCAPRTVLVASLAALVASIAAALLLVNAMFALFVAIGAFADVLLYTIYAKRRTWLSIFLGSIAGATPVLGGYASITGMIDARSILLALLIVAWIPAHIWSLVIHYKDDYVRARIPMLPVLVGERLAKRLVGLSILAYTLDTLGLYALGVFPLPVVAVALPLGALSIASLSRCHEGDCFTTFKLVNITLGITLSVFIAERLVVAAASKPLL